jgi:hypothetical protein
MEMLKIAMDSVSAEFLLFLVFRWHLYLCVYCIPYNVILTTRSSFVGRDSIDDIATRYGLDDPGIEFRWGRDFPHPSRPALGSTQHPIHFVTGLHPGGKASGSWR